MNCQSCNKPVENHEAGWETDRCIAEKLGWTDINITDLSTPWEFTDPPEARQILGYGMKPSDAMTPHKRKRQLPHYSTKIECVEELIEKIKKGFQLLYTQAYDWVITSEDSLIIASTIPLAVCHAFLVKGEEDG